MNGGKRKANKSLKSWVAFVKKVQREESLSYKDAIHRAKQRKDKGEKWMKGGDAGDSSSSMAGDYSDPEMTIVGDEEVDFETPDKVSITEQDIETPYKAEGGRRRRRRTMRGRRRTHRRGTRRSSRRHRRR